MISKKLSLLLLGISVLFSGCLDKDANYYERMPQEAYFDFSLNQNISLDIDYGFNSRDYIVLFDIYDKNPMLEKEDGSIEKKEGVTPLFRAATDGSGKYSGETRIPSDLSEVWLYSDFLGTVSPVKLPVQSGTISFDQKTYLASLQQKATRGTTPKQHTYPDDWLVMGDWDQYGTPDYLEPYLASPPSNVLYSILDIFTTIASKQITTRYPEFFDGRMSSDIRIIKPTKVNLVFINSTAGWDNAVGYFTYPTDKKPTSANEVQRILIYPNASPLAKSATKRGALLCGDQVQLKYWDGKEFHDEFPAGISIGWWLEGMGFQSGGNLKVEKDARYTRYSLDELNSDKKQRTVSLRDKNSDQIVAIGFEDNIDMKYNDASFYLAIEEKDAIDTDTPVLPDVNPPGNADNSTEYKGTLTFEDLWPSLGDYDMNDMMLTYKSTVYKTIVGNRVNKIIDEFTVYHNGGTLQNGFGYQFHNLSPDDIRSVKIEGKATSKYMEGQMLEPGQTHPTILLFDDIREVVNEKFTVTIILNDVGDSNNALPPYNPFIFSKSNEGRGTEVHLSKYPPTDKANYSLFGTESDGSRPEDRLFYVASHFWYQYPFAINLPITNFPPPTELMKIDAQYPKFRSWANSSGTTDKDWYKYPKE